MNKEDKHQQKEHTQGAHKGHRKVFDVVPPGRAPASATSRPVIMGHKPPVPDDQFVAATKTTLPDVSDDVAEGAKAPEVSARAGNPAERHTLLNPKHKVEITPSHADFEVGSVATAADVQQPVEAPNNTEASSLGAVDQAKAQASTSTPTSPSTGTTAIAEAEESANESTPAFSVTGQSSDMPAGLSANTGPGATPAPSSQTTARTNNTSSVWEMPDDKDGAHDSSHDVAGTTTAPPASPTITTSTTSTILQHLNDEEAKNTPTTAPSQRHSSKTIDELLAETGAPDLGPANEPPQKTIISHHQPHQSHMARNLIITLVVLLVLAVVIADILLDGGFITTKLHIPHTHFF